MGLDFKNYSKNPILLVNLSSRITSVSRPASKGYWCYYGHTSRITRWSPPDPFRKKKKPPPSTTTTKLSKPQPTTTATHKYQINPKKIKNIAARCKKFKIWTP